MKAFLGSFAAFFLISLSAHSVGEFEGTFYSEASVPATITNVEFHLFDMAKSADGCSSKGRCYRMDVLLNGVHVARVAVSPGNPHQKKAINTPTMDGLSLDPGRLMGKGYKNNPALGGDPMPYAMFTKPYKNQKGTNKPRSSGVAIHAGHVTGDKASHGCIRVESFFAPIFSKWVKEAFANGGEARVWAQDTDGTPSIYRW